MHRTDVIQSILDKRENANYLEIGVNRGSTFFPIKARRKTAVDPKFCFSKTNIIRWMVKNPWNIFAQYHQTTSDEYFSSTRKSSPLDVVFVDGLHTFSQSLKDVENSLERLKENGVIVMHDCLPQNKAASHPANSPAHAASLGLPGWTGAWSGDVWKTICYLRSLRRDLRAFVLNCDHGLGIIMNGIPDNVLNFSEQDIEKMIYEEFEPNKKEILNLKDEAYFGEFLKTI
jgi:hypothetical protein